MKALLVVVLMILCCCSCITYVPVKKSLPPEIRLSGEHAEIVLVNRFDTSGLDFNNLNKTQVFRNGFEKYLQGLFDGFATNGHYNLYQSDSLLRISSNEIPPEMVRNLCDLAGKEHLLSLDVYNLYFDQDMEIVKNDDGSRTRIAHYDLVAFAQTTLYDGEGTVIYQAQDQQRILYDSREVLIGLLAVGPSMGKAGNPADDLSYQLGLSHIDKFLPGSTTEMREFFVSKGFASAYYAYESGDWNRVEDELMKLSENAKTKIAGRAAYNLSVLYDHLGESEKSTQWYEQAKAKLGDKTPKVPLNRYIQVY